MFATNCAALGLSDQSRQQVIAFRRRSCQSLGVFNFGIEEFAESGCRNSWIMVWSSIAAEPTIPPSNTFSCSTGPCGKPRQRLGRISRLFSAASCCHPQAVQHCWASSGSLNQSRQQSIALCSLSSHRLGFLDLSIEELVEGSNQLLWWTFLDDGAHFVGKTY